MPSIDTTNRYVTQINQITVKPENQARLLAAMREQIDHTMRHRPGFRSASLHAATDGTRVVNYVQFDTADQLDAAHASSEFQQRAAGYRALIEEGGPRLYRVDYTREATGGQPPSWQPKGAPSTSVFTDAERSYLEGQPLGRLATVGPDGAPQTRPVGFNYNLELDTVDIGGRNLAASRKYRNVQADPRVSFVVDDLASTQSWRPRGVEIRGTAETLTADPMRPGFTSDLIRIHPARVLAWGLDTDAFAAPHVRNVPDAP